MLSQKRCKRQLKSNNLTQLLLRVVAGLLLFFFPFKDSYVVNEIFCTLLAFTHSDLFVTGVYNKTYSMPFFV